MWNALASKWFRVLDGLIHAVLVGDDGIRGCVALDVYPLILIYPFKITYALRDMSRPISHTLIFFFLPSITLHCLQDS